MPAYLYINNGARKLLAVLKRQPQAMPQVIFVGYVCFAALYVFLTLHDPARRVPSGSTSLATYYLPDWLIVTTLIIPRLIMWFWGIQAVYYMFLYRVQVGGRIYKQALGDLVAGLGIVIGITILIRCVQSIASQLGQASLGLILPIAYVLLILLGAGYIYIVRGVKRLQKIEEI